MQKIKKNFIFKLKLDNKTPIRCYRNNIVTNYRHNIIQYSFLTAVGHALITVHFETIFFFLSPRVYVYLLSPTPLLLHWEKKIRVCFVRKYLVNIMLTRVFDKKKTLRYTIMKHICTEWPWWMHIIKCYMRLKRLMHYLQIKYT